MTNQEIEQRLKQEIEHMVPDKESEILHMFDVQKELVTPVAVTPKRKRHHLMRLVSAAAALLLLTVAGLSVYRSYFSIDSVVELDVNPSIEIKVNSREKVLDVIPVNEDGTVILDGMDLRKTDLTVAVNAIIGSMLKNGYISDLKNSLLISVENEDQAKGSALQQKLTEQIEECLAVYSVEGSILSQTVDMSDSNLSALAQQYGISMGKARLIQELTEENPALTFETLAGCSIHELNLLASSKNTELKDINVTGNASSKGYISEEEALEAALQHAGVARDSLRRYETEFDWDDGMMVYEVEFISAGKEYDYEVNAVTGEILKWETDYADDEDWREPVSDDIPDQYISEEEAKQTAVSKSGVSEADIRNFKCKLDREDREYEVEFYAGDQEYECTIDALTGQITEWDVERIDDD